MNKHSTDDDGSIRKTWVLLLLGIKTRLDMMRNTCIPDICHCYYTSTISDLEILHLKVRKLEIKQCKSTLQCKIYFKTCAHCTIHKSTWDNRHFLLHSMWNIHFALQTNTYYNMTKYTLQFEQITFQFEEIHSFNFNKYILQ